MLLILSKVVHYKVLLAAVAVRGIKIVVLHLLKCLVKAPAVLVEPVNRTHVTRSVASAGTVNIENTRLRIVNGLQERSDLLVCRRPLINDRDIDVVQTSSL